MSSENKNLQLEKANNNNSDENNKIKGEESKENEDHSEIQKNLSELIPKGENDKNFEKEDKLQPYTPYILNSFYQILINKIMPSGYKLETEEILLKKDEKRQKTYLHRKHKKQGSSILENKNENENNNTNGNNINIEENNDIKGNPIIKSKKSRMKNYNSFNEGLPGLNKKDSGNLPFRRMTTREHKPKIIEDLGYIDKDVIKGKSNPLFRAVNKICEKGIMKMKKIPYYSFFYNSSKPDEPSLIKIEKNIRDFKYQSTYEFIMDLRRLWNHFLKIYNEQIEIKERVCEMCRISEQLYCELESINIEKVELEEMNKKVDNLERKLRELKGNSLQFNIGNFNLKKTNSNERSMSLNEKTIIKNNIKLLTIEQKKGIANILRDTIDTANKKVLEFDIDKLNNKKLKQLDEYVKNCLRDNNLNQEKLDLDVQKLKNDLTDNNIKNTNNNEQNNNKDNFDIEKDIENSSISDSSSYESN